MMPRRAEPKTWMRAEVWAAAVLVVMFSYFLLQNLHRIRDQQRMSDFRTFYAAAVAMADGKSPYHLDVPRAYVYPPMLAFLYMPLARLSSMHAASVALAVDVAVVIAALWVGTKEL